MTGKRVCQRERVTSFKYSLGIFLGIVDHYCDVLFFHAITCAEYTWHIDNVAMVIQARSIGLHTGSLPGLLELRMLLR